MTTAASERQVEIGSYFMPPRPAGVQQALEKPGPTDAGKPAVPRRRRLVLAGLGGVYAVAAVLLVASYHAAAHQPGPAVFTLFWAGMLAPFVVTVLALWSPLMSAASRAGLLVTLGVFGTLPKLLRTPTGPLYFDELAHWRQVRDLVDSGVVGRPNGMLRALPSFPGLHTLTASIEHLTGVSTWTAAVGVILVAHVLGLLAVYALATVAARQMGTAPGAASRIGAIAAVVYATNSSWLYFDTQFAYETLAVPIVFSILALAAMAVRDERGRPVLAGAVAALCLAVAVVHHSSALVLAALLLVLAAVFARPGANRPDARAALAVVGAGLGGLVLWLARSWHLLVAYLGPYLTSGFGQLAAVAGGLGGGSGEASAGGSRRLFTGTSLPPYEVVAAFAAPVVLAVVVGALIVVGRRSSARSQGRLRVVRAPAACVLAVLAGGYFVSLPFLLTVGMSDTARRSWTYSMAGVAFFVAVALSGLAGRWAEWRPMARRGAATAAVLALCVVVVGNVAAGQNETYRFPGPRAQGSDIRSLDAEAFALADWLATHVPRDSRVATDRFTASLATSVGLQRLVVPWAGEPTWQLFAGDRIEPEYTTKLLRHGFDYLVVDNRMATLAPAIGYWYDRNEPAWVHEAPTAVAHLRRLDCVDWAAPTFATEHYTVYRLDLSRFDHAQLVAIGKRLAALTGQEAVAGSSGTTPEAAASPVARQWPAPSAHALSVLRDRRCP
jgi:hypothetical protein